MVPAGTYHAEVETATCSLMGTVEADARELLPELAEQYTPQEEGRYLPAPGSADHSEFDGISRHLGR